jgi:hypothetical protein
VVDDIGVLYRVRVLSGGDQPGEVRHVTISFAPDESAISRKGGEVELPRVADQPATISFGLVFVASRSTSSMSDAQVLAADVVGDDLVQLARDVQLHPVGRGDRRGRAPCP